MNFKIIVISAVLVSACWLSSSTDAFAAQSNLGSMVSADDGSVYMVLETIKRPYSSAGAFLSYNFNSWANLQKATAEDLSLKTGDIIPPRDGSIVCSDRGVDKGTCYLITDSKKAAFVSMDVFTQSGYKMSKALSGDVSFLQSTDNITSVQNSRRVGTLLFNDGTYFLVGKSGLIKIPNESILNSWGYTFDDAIPGNIVDINLSVRFEAEARRANELRPFEPVIPVALNIENKDKFAVPFVSSAKPEITEAWLYSSEERDIHGNANHGGIDFAQPRGTAVYAAADGYAISSTHLAPQSKTYQGKTIGFGLGEFVQIWHPRQGVYTSYSHLSKVSQSIPYFKPDCEKGFCDPEVVYKDSSYSVSRGKAVKRGDLIGYVGDSGLSWGYTEKPRGKQHDPVKNPSWDETHLHFEMYTRVAPNYTKSRRYDPFGIYGRLNQYTEESYSEADNLWKKDVHGQVEYAK